MVRMNLVDVVFLVYKLQDRILLLWTIFNRFSLIRLIDFDKYEIIILLKMIIPVDITKYPKRHI